MIAVVHDLNKYISNHGYMCDVVDHILSALCEQNCNKVHYAPD